MLLLSQPYLVAPLFLMDFIMLNPFFSRPAPCFIIIPQLFYPNMYRIANRFCGTRTSHFILNPVFSIHQERVHCRH